MRRLKFDSEKAIEVILYIAKLAQIPDIYHVLKVMYFADKEHLANYGRFICNDRYIAMKHGPVPSEAFDIVKHVRGDGYHSGIDEHAVRAFEVTSDHIIKPSREAYLDLLSESDRICLNEAIKKYSALSFSELKKLSHDQAYESADENDEIPIEAIAATLPDGDLLIQYLSES